MTDKIKMAYEIDSCGANSSARSAPALLRLARLPPRPKPRRRVQRP